MLEFSCTTEECDMTPNFRYTWPGKDEAYICMSCAMKLNNVAQAMGLHQQFIQLTTDDYVELSKEAK